MKYNEGDIVRVKKNLDLGQTYDGWNISSEMLKYCGYLLRIEEVDVDYQCYKLRLYYEETYSNEILDANEWYELECFGWTDSMLENPLKEKLKEFLRNG